MDYQRFIQQLPQFYENLGQASIHPKSDQFQAVLDRVKGMTTANVMQLLNFAVECMEPDEVYCEIGCFQGSTLIGALLNHPDKVAYAVDDFSEFDDTGENFDALIAHLNLFNQDQQVLFCNQGFEEFFFDLKEINPDLKIGVYFYDGAHDYRSQLLGLLLAKPFLADQALIIVDDSNWSSVQQANWDFLATHPHCQLLLDLPTPKDGYRTFWNGLHVFIWDVNQQTNYSWSIFDENHRSKPFIKALYNFHFDFEFKQKQESLNSLYKEAVSRHVSGQLDTAERKYQEVLQWDKNHAQAWHDLGMVYYHKEKYPNALERVLISLRLNPSISLHHYSLGLILEKLGNTAKAIEAYQQSITLNPRFIDAYNNLGNILSTIGDLEQAESIYQQAIDANPDNYGSYLNLGNILMAKEHFNQAIDAYQKAIQLKPNNSDIFQNLGLAYAAKSDQPNSDLAFGYSAYYQGNYEESITRFQQVLGHSGCNLNFYKSLANCYKNLNQQEEAIQIYRQAIENHPNSDELYLSFIAILQHFGRLEEAIAVASEASQLFLHDLAVKLETQRILPIIYDDTAEIDCYRHRFTQYLEDLIQQTSLDNPEARKNALKGIGHRTNFYLQYQCKNDLALQIKYGEFVHHVITANYPQWVQPRPMPSLSQSGKIRVGYISNCFYLQTVNKLFSGWLKQHNAEQVEVYCYYGSLRVDARTQLLRVYSHAFHHIPNNLEGISKQILADQLHILVFLDLGMHPTLTQIAGLRLAPVQCLTWGHPITSGLPTIDYFLSSDLMEPENGENHYSEQLIRLPNIGISYPKPVLPKTRKRRSEFKLRPQSTVYLSCQSTFKYLPQYDYIFAAIAQRVPQAQFAFLSHPSDSITQQFLQRLKKAFAGFGLDSEDYCVTLSRLNQNDYLSLNLVSDVFLDTLGWSGGNTTLEAIACNLPVVTCPGEFMRGRHSYGILRMLGVTDTIANDEAEYIDIAVRLGLDPQWRKSIVAQIVANHDRLYDDKTCVEALEAFYERVVEDYPRKPDFI
ncbi:tetratricopeptide repeat protein [Coleofasciculus chthonoplastes]|uniref:tetratricopeptide repeat protein n=1 Tax=Coleofasciculus chthonoplastes TaxID=64178 RepID=UPI0032F85D9D